MTAELHLIFHRVSEFSHLSELFLSTCISNKQEASSRRLHMCRPPGVPCRLFRGCSGTSVKLKWLTYVSVTEVQLSLVLQEAVVGFQQRQELGSETNTGGDGSC